MKCISIDERAIELAHYIIDSKDTVRGTAKKFGISKSTVHKDVSERLMKINPILAKEVREILDENKAERHIRGGMATKLKYSRLKWIVNYIKISETAHKSKGCFNRGDVIFIIYCLLFLSFKYFSLVALPPRIWHSSACFCKISFTFLNNSGLI